MSLHALRSELLVLSSQEYSRGEDMLKSMSGADQSDSEVHFCASQVYQAVALLGPDELAGAVARADHRWRAYARQVQARVEAAPKIRRGPSAGHSVISHRWVSEDAFLNYSHHIRTMIRIVRERVEAESEAKWSEAYAAAVVGIDLVAEGRESE